MEFLSIVTLLNYDEHLFDDVMLPALDMDGDGVDDHFIDKDILINEICFECSDLQLIYPDGDYMKTMLGYWSKSEQNVWRKMFYTDCVEYNPLWNVDADVIETNSGDNSGTSKGNNTESVKGYNSDDWAEHTKDDTDSESSGKWSESRKTRRTGNIGITSSQELLERERAVAQFNIYKYIVDSFKRRFCVMVY